MDTLTHFIFSMIVGLAVAFRLKHRVRNLVAIAFLSILIDIDHFFSLVPRGTFHNVFVVILLPLLIFLYFYKTEKKGIKWQTFSLVLLVMLTGHLVVDSVTGIKPLYPVSDEYFFFPDVFVQVTRESLELYYTEEGPSAIVTPFGVALTIYALILLTALFVEDFIYFFKARHERFKKAVRDTKKDLF